MLTPFKTAKVLLKKAIRGEVVDINVVVCPENNHVKELIDEILEPCCHLSSLKLLFDEKSKGIEIPNMDDFNDDEEEVSINV